MSFYIVPLMSYQTKQKLKEKSKEKDSSRSGHRRKKRSSIDSSGSLIYSSHSTIPLTPASHFGDTNNNNPSSGESRSGSDQIGNLYGSERLANSRSRQSQSATSKRGSNDASTPTGSRQFNQGSVGARHLNLSQLTSEQSQNKAFENSDEPSKTRREESSRSRRSSYAESKVSRSNNNSRKIDSSASKPESFTPLIDLDLLNTPETLRQAVLNPVDQAKRYSKFSEIFLGFHWADPINFLNFRLLILVKFMNRQTAALASESNENDNVHLIESDLMIKLFEMRDFIRKLIRRELKTRGRSLGDSVPEELLAVSLMNYTRFLLDLPEKEKNNSSSETTNELNSGNESTNTNTTKPPFERIRLGSNSKSNSNMNSKSNSRKSSISKLSDGMTSSEHIADNSSLHSTTESLLSSISEYEFDWKTHYDFKADIQEIQLRLHKLNKEENGVVGLELLDIDSFMQVITRVLNEFVMLEAYHIQMSCKLQTGFISDPRIIRRFFEKFQKNCRSAEIGRPFETVKVLHYNVFHSVYYLWFLATLTPFVNVYEMGIPNEDSYLLNNASRYYSVRLPLQFDGKDEKMHKEYYSKLKIHDWTSFQDLTPEQLGSLQQLLIENNNGTTDAKSKLALKPPNFEYYSKSLRTIPNNTFDMIHLKDMVLQLTNSNFKVILREFYRILKDGGVLDLPTLQLASNSISSLIKVKDVSTYSLGEWGIQKFDDLDKIANFVQVLLYELRTIFGEGNVKYSVVLLSVANEINMYRAKYIIMRVFELQGLVCTLKQIEETDLTDYGVYYMIQIQATKQGTK